MFARTSRLTLRPGWPEDAPALTAAIAHESVASKSARLPWPYTLGDAQDWLSRPAQADQHPLLIFAHDRGPEPVLVGGTGLHANEVGTGAELEIGYWLTPSAWGRGYATEAGHATVQMARHALGRRWLSAYHHADNPASGRVLRKLGFRETGRASRYSLARRAEVESVTYEMAL